VMLRLILFVVLAYFVWRILESVLRLTAKQGPGKGGPQSSPHTAKKTPAPPFRDIRDAEFEDITPKKEGSDDSPSHGS
jgi:hypothetical protein